MTNNAKKYLSYDAKTAEDKANILGEYFTRALQTNTPIEISIGAKHNPGSTTPGQAIHGSTGLFSEPGLEQDMFSTVITPMQGLASALPVQPQGSSRPADPQYGGFDAPLFGVITGVTDEGDVTEPTDYCDDQPEGGLLELCILTAPYGRIGRGFKIQLDEVGRLVNRGEQTDLQVLNPLLNTPNPFSYPSNIPNGAGGALMNELNARMIVAATQLQRKVAPIIWQGNPNLTQGQSGYQEFTGMETLVNTGKVSIDGIACPAADSHILNFDFELINGAGRDIARYLDNAIYYATDQAQKMALDPVTFAFVMREDQFEELTRFYAVRYYQQVLAATLGDAGASQGGRYLLNGTEMTDMREQMRQGQFLPVRGQRIPVLIDNSIPEKNSTTNAELAAGQFAADIYCVPMTVMGGRPVLYWEFFNQANGQANQLVNFMQDPFVRWTDGGIFEWRYRQRNGCYEADFTMRPRIILRTPFLATRIQDVSYEPLTHSKQWEPDSDYFFAGGATNQPQRQYYTDYSTTTPVTIG